MKICITPVKICRTHIKTEHMYCKGIHNSLVKLYKYVVIFKEVTLQTQLSICISCWEVDSAPRC